MNLRDLYGNARQHGIRYAFRNYLADFLKRPQESSIIPESSKPFSSSVSRDPNAQLLSLENLAATEGPKDMYKAEITQPDGDPLLPKSIRVEDIPNLQKLLAALKAPYLHVIVSPDDNRDGYSEINLSVRAKALPRDFDLKRYIVDQPLVEELGLENLLVFSPLGGVPLMVATNHVFGALKKLAEPNSYNTQMSRSRLPPLDYAQGNTKLRIGSSRFNVFYSEDSRGVLERGQVIKIGPDQWMIMGEEFPR